MKTINSLRVAGIFLVLGLLSYTDDFTRSNIGIETETVRTKIQAKNMATVQKCLPREIVFLDHKHQDY